MSSHARLARQGRRLAGVAKVGLRRGHNRLPPPLPASLARKKRGRRGRLIRRGPFRRGRPTACAVAAGTFVAVGEAAARPPPARAPLRPATEVGLLQEARGQKRLEESEGPHVAPEEAAPPCGAVAALNLSGRRGRPPRAPLQPAT